ncbi:MAG TPA: CocE/NonD family hydrolase, partial [Ilumatobacteraceae bacterium]|nr:CocE/NonD family hydrolase [Ilumatobacteraceae bacterium]
MQHLIEEIETEWIPLRDGRRLAVRLFLPRSAHHQPAPVVLEYIPYRRRDGTRIGDEAMHRWFAAAGYACARVDIAGMGDSDGLIEDEYVRREQDDGLEVIEWLARQPWSSGSVGMIGISWGGFNGLQIAARRPPALKAVISLCSTVDRYHGDVHYTGGCLNEENLEWGGYFFTMNG